MLESGSAERALPRAKMDEALHTEYVRGHPGAARHENSKAIRERLVADGAVGHFHSFLL